MITCFLPVASTAFLNSSLSHALTSPCRLISAASGCMSIISLGRGPFWPVSALVVRTTGRLKTLAIAACARMLFFKATGVRSRASWKSPS